MHFKLQLHRLYIAFIGRKFLNIIFFTLVTIVHVYKVTLYHSGNCLTPNDFDIFCGVRGFFACKSNV